MLKEKMRNISFMLVFFSVLACKPKTDPASEVRSLDNFTRSDGASLTANRCGPDVADAQRLKNSRVYAARYKMIFAPAAIKDEILATLAAVPDPVQVAFFGVGGSIQVKSDISDACQFKSANEKDFASEKQTSPAACWRKQEGSAPPVIFVTAKKEAIRHGLLRSFSFIYTQLFVPGAEKLGSALPEGEKKEVLSAALARFSQQKNILTEALMRDAVALGSDVERRLRAQRQASESEFSDFVMAEALDSFYCSKESNAVMQARFKNTFAALTKGSGSAPGLAFDLGRPWY